MMDYKSIDAEIEALNKEIAALEKTLEDDDDWRSVKETQNDIVNLRHAISRLEEMRAAQKPVTQTAKPSPKIDKEQIAKLTAARDALRSKIDLLDDRIDNRTADLDKDDVDLQHQAEHIIEQTVAERDRLENDLINLEAEIKKLSQNAL